MSKVIVHRRSSPIEKVELPLQQFEDRRIEDGPSEPNIVVKPLGTSTGGTFELRAELGWAELTREELRALGTALIELSDQPDD